MNITVLGATGAIGEMSDAAAIDTAVAGADIAAFTAAQARDTQYIKAAPAISN